MFGDEPDGDQAAEVNGADVHNLHAWCVLLCGCVGAAHSGDGLFVTMRALPWRSDLSALWDRPSADAKSCDLAGCCLRLSAEPEGLSEVKRPRY